jgi:hypothetical protein
MGDIVHEVGHSCLFTLPTILYVPTHRIKQDWASVVTAGRFRLTITVQLQRTHNILILDRIAMGNSSECIFVLYCYKHGQFFLRR